MTPSLRLTKSPETTAPLPRAFAAHVRDVNGDLDLLDAAVAAKATNPMTASGDLIVGGASGTPVRLGVGSNGQVLTVVGGSPAWAAPAVPIVPECRCYHSGPQSIAGAATPLAFDSERWDTDALHDVVTNNSRLTCRTAGKYLVFGGAQFAAGAGSYRQLYVLVNGVSPVVLQMIAPVVGNATAMQVATVCDLAVGDYAQLVVAHDAGAALNVTANAQYSPEFGCVRVGG